MTIALISHQDCLRHHMGEHHPESPERLAATLSAIAKSNLQDKFKHYEAPIASIDAIMLAHRKDYIDTIEQKSPNEGLIQLDSDTLMSPGSLIAAKRAAGALTRATELVLNKAHDKVFCAVRPPGHHAEIAQAMGFCLFDNVAIAALNALAHDTINKVAIVDFDVHHGNGTEDILKDNHDVLFISSFQENIYPNPSLQTQNPHHVKIPLPAGCKGDMFKKMLADTIVQHITSFKPDILYISAGFDAHRADPLAGLNLEADDFLWLTQHLVALANEHCQGRLISCLEGGYHLTALQESVLAHLEGLSL